MGIKSFSEYVTEATKEVTFTFGRYNPPTIGHEKLFDAVKKNARSGAYRIYTSKSQDAKKNPLEFKDKVKFVRKMFPKHARSIIADKSIKTAIEVATDKELVATFEALCAAVNAGELDAAIDAASNQLRSGFTK